MKKGSVIFILFLCVSFFWSLSTQAQQQKKPSERSFTAEVNKVKQIQAARNAKVRQMQQPAENSQIPNTDIQPANEPTPAKTGNTNANPSNDKAPQSSGTKPSTGPMKQPRKPVGSKG